MNVFYNVRLGIADIIQNIGRSLITMVGIILGAMSVIAVLALVNGARQHSLQWMEERGGALNLTIRPDWSFNIDKQREVAMKRLTVEDVSKIRQAFPTLKKLNPIINRWYPIMYKDNFYWVPVSGVLPAYEDVENFHVGQGRFISEFDNQQGRNVIVIGTKIQEILFPNESPIGKKVNFRNTTFTVIGVMEHKELQSWNHNSLEWMNRKTFIPLNAFIKRIDNTMPVNSLSFLVNSIDEVEPTQQRMDQFLRALRNGKKVFQVRTNKDQIDEIQNTSGKTDIIFGLIASISLLVGGIVITNVVLASIRERMREIGVRMAVGAKRRDILVQFLVQTILVSFIGGVIGIIAGLSLLQTLGAFLKSPVTANFHMVIIALFLSVGIGLIAGIFPAIAASRANPVKILRYE